MKLKIFAVSILALTLSTSATAQSMLQKVFTDVPTTHKYHTAIRYLKETEVIKGYDDSTFRPDKEINRAEVLKIILKGSSIESDASYSADFPDVQEDDWFAPFVLKAKALGIVKGNADDGTFAPKKTVNRAEFLKMLLEANEIDVTLFAEENPLELGDVWYKGYMNYAAIMGLINNNDTEANKQLTRADVASMMYLLSLITHGEDTQFLLTRSENELVQTDIYLSAKMPGEAKYATSLAVDLSQKAYRNMPDNDIVLGAAKLARAYDYLVDAYIYAVRGENENAGTWANKAIDKASEAWEVNNDTQEIAKHIKDMAREILTELDIAED